ncbi:DNA circularization N-terminal domain-containing protein [Leptothoe sp. LEGE 181152]|nr:DNA circularization N-terminal domain-containing protein [Leptothoe sp. LEGE 181152]
MPIELAKIQLDRVHKVDTLERAALVHHQVPGLEGNITQNLGRNSVRLQIEGIFYGTSAEEDLETLRKAYKQREPVDFLADIVGRAYFSQVVLEQFDVLQAAQAPEQFSYRLTIAEYVPPKPSTIADAAAVDQAIQSQAQLLLDVATLPEALSMGSLPALTNPAEPLQGALNQITVATEELPAVADGLRGLLDLKIEPVQPPAQEIPEPPELTLSWQPKPSLQTLLESGVPIERLLQSGISVNELLEAGVAISDLLAAGVSAKALLQAGVTAETLLQAGVTVDALLGAGLSAEQVLKAGGSVEDLLAAGLSVEALLNAGATVEDLLTAGVPVSDLLQAGVALDELLTAGVGADVLLAAGVSMEDLTAAGVDPEQLKALTQPGDLPPVETAQIVLLLVDEAGNAIANTAYDLLLPDGTRQSGQLDNQGRAQIEARLTETYSLSFPELDAADWELLTSEASEQSESPSDRPSTDQPAERPSDRPPIEPPEPNARISITLVDDAGQPLADETYELTSPDGTVQTGQLSPQGEATLEQLSIGTYGLSFPNLDAADWELLPSEAIDPHPGLPVDDAPIDDGSPESPAERPVDRDSSESPDAVGSHALVNIVLVDDAGQPMANARYVLSQSGETVREGTLDAQGHIRLDDLLVGAYEISFPELDADDWQLTSGTPSSIETPTETPVPPATDPTDISRDIPTDSPDTSAPPNIGSITLSLVDDAGQPMVNETYELTWPDGTVQTGHLSPQGDATLEQLPVGTYGLSFPNLDAADWELQASETETQQPATPEDRPPLPQTPTQPPAESRPDETSGAPSSVPESSVAPPVQATAQVIITLVDDAGQPMANESYVLSQAGETVRTGTLDDQGNIRLDQLLPGAYEITFPELDQGDWQLAPTLDETEPQELTRDLPRESPVDDDRATDPSATKWLALTVLDDDNRPLTGLRYELYQDDERVQTGVLDDQGRLRVEGLAGTVYTLSFPELDQDDWQWLEE